MEINNEGAAEGLRYVPSSPAHEKLPTLTLSSRLTKSIPVHDPHHNLPFLPFHGFVQFLSQTTAEILAPPFA